MSEGYEYDEDGNLIKRISKKTTIKVDSGEIAEKVKEKIDEDRAMLEWKALDTFDQLKHAIANTSGDQAVLDIGTPQLLQDYLKTHMVKKRVTQGKSIIRGERSGEEFDTPEQLLDSIYGRAYDRHGNKIETEDGLEARNQIKEMINAYRKGSYKAFRRDHRAVEVKNLMSCSKCNATIKDYPCENCGYNPYEEPMQRYSEERID